MTNRPKKHCIICKERILYVWDKEETTNLEDGCDVIIRGDYGSVFDMEIHSAAICDKCIKKLIGEELIKYEETLQFKTEVWEDQ
jgi:hypothetical protein